ncbi:hypothetical protein ACHAWF_011100, partial [Thalassiosira exigua]
MVGDPPEEEVAAAAAADGASEERPAAATDAADGGEGEGADEPAAVASGEPASDGVAAEEDDGAKVEDDDGGDDDGGDDDEGEAPPQPQAREGGAAYLRKSTNESEGELVDCYLTPDFMGQKQNLKDALQGDPAVPPPLAEGGGDGGGGGEPQSALHRDEYAKYEIEGGHDPRHHESALNSDPSPGSSAPEGNASSSSALSGLNPFKSRRKPRLVAGKGGAKGHSHPRKSPYKSEVARLRHAQQLEREKRDFSKDPPDDGTAGSSASKGPSIKDTTAPPDTAFFSIQSAKFKHNLLHSLGEFLTSAFADDEEASGSYFGDDLLEQLESNDPRLKGVWLQAKNLDDEHVRRLCEALLRNKVVAEVWLPSNRITDVGASHVAHMLKFNRSIRELFLGDNDIGPRGASALAGALARNNSTLVALGLGDNRIGVEGAGAFAAALRHNHTLHTLDVKNNGIPRRSSIRGLLAKMLEFNASDPGDESLVMGLQEELAGLVASLPPDAAERAVVQAEEALKRAMLCRRRGDRIGAAEAEGAFIRICTTGEPPVDPPEETEGGEGG